MKRNNWKRPAALALCACLLAALSACGSPAASTGEPASEPATEDTAPVEDTAPAEDADETAGAEVTEEAPMVPAVADLEPDADGNVTVTDMAGREVTYPANPVVWNSSPTCEGWLCAIVPEQIVGWAAEFTEEQLSYYPASVAGLPTVGGNFSNNEANTEGVLAYAPDVIINTFDVSSEQTIAAAVKQADSMSEQYGIPVLVLSSALEDTPENAANLGLWLGHAQRGAEVSAYLQGLMDKVDATVAAVPADAVVRYYYAEATDGLSTESADSVHAAVFAYCGLEAAVGEDVTLSNFGGMEPVSLEQVLQWDPEYIFVWNAQAYQSIVSDDSWSDITAVQNGNVYLNPSLPQNWFDRSPNSLRVLGCLYTAATCYPDYCTYDLDEEIKGYFDFMYGVELTDGQLAALY